MTYTYVYSIIRVQGKVNSAQKGLEMKFRNWIEAALQKQIAWTPAYVGSKGGRKIYAVMFEGGTEADYYIDFDNKTIEAY